MESMNWSLIVSSVLPWVLLGIGIFYFIFFKKDSKKNWKDKIEQLIFKVVKRIKDGDLTWDEAFELIKWIFAKEPSEEQLGASIKALKAKRKS